jgi:predicted small integral membrane protein
MVLAVAAFALLVAFNNLTDYGSNFLFVRHVLSMDTTFPGNAAMYRAITAPAAWHAVYGLIIAAEGVTGLLLVCGAVSMWRARHASGVVFERAKKWGVVGAAAGFLLWFLVFMVGGGEWFLMWQSKTWTGQDAAFRIYAAILGVLVFVNQPDPDIA